MSRCDANTKLSYVKRKTAKSPRDLAVVSTAESLGLRNGFPSISGTCSFPDSNVGIRFFRSDTLPQKGLRSSKLRENFPIQFHREEPIKVRTDLEVGFLDQQLPGQFVQSF